MKFKPINYHTHKHARARMHTQNSYIAFRLEDMMIYYCI